MVKRIRNLSVGRRTESYNATHGFPELMTELEVIKFLRIPEVSKGKDPANVIKNLKRMRGLPCIYICRQPLYPKQPVQDWISKQIHKEQG